MEELKAIEKDVSSLKKTEDECMVFNFSLLFLIGICLDPSFSIIFNQIPF